MSALTILLTGTRAPATLDLARRLQRCGHRVIGADSMRYPLARFSNALENHYRLPPPQQAAEAFRQALVEVVQQENVDLLWPTCEEIFHVAKHHSELSQHTRLLCAPLEELLPLHHKLQFTQLVTALGTTIQAPASWPASSAPTQERLVWKPCFSRFAAQTRFQDPPPETAGWMAQQFVAGNEFCSWAICQDGAVRVLTMYENTAQAGRGAGCAFKPYWSPEAAEFVRILALARQFTGALAFDFMRSLDGNIFVLECNPRMTSGIHLLADHVDFGSLLERPLPFPPAMREAQLALPVLLTKPRQVGASPDVIFHPEDQAPFWTQFLCAGEFALRAWRTRSSLLAATTKDIEYNG
jgi:hypothetical protein